MVQRYDECDYCGDEYSPDSGMTKANDGDYIEYADYEKAINSYEKLVGRLRRELRGGETTISKQIIFQALKESEKA